LPSTDTAGVATPSLERGDSLTEQEFPVQLWTLSTASAEVAKSRAKIASKRFTGVSLVVVLFDND
jgi:hypothetical protein